MKQVELYARVRYAVQVEGLSDGRRRSRWVGVGIWCRSSSCASPPEPPPIAMNATPILPGLSPVEGKPLTATFDAGRLSSDGGVIVLREIADAPRAGRDDHRTAP